MAINPVTGKEEKQLPTDISGKVDTTGMIPVGAKSLTSNVTPINVNIGGTSSTLPNKNDAFNVPQKEVNGGPALNLDAINVARKSKNLPILEHTTTPQPSTETVSNVSGGLSNLKPVSTTTQTTTTEIKPTVTPPATTTTQPVATGVDADIQAQKIIDNIFSTNNLSQDEKNWWNTNVFNNPQERKKFLQMTDTERQSYMTNINEANKLTRDASLKADYEKQSFDRKIADAQAQSDLDRNKMKADIEAQVNNFAMAQGTSGRLQSRNLQSAINQQLDLSKQTYDTLVATQDRYLQALADEYKYNNTVASNNFNDAMSTLKKDLQEKIQALQKTGALQTQSGLLQAKDFISSAVANADNAMKQYNFNLQVAQDRVKTLSEQLKAKSTVDDNVTKTMNDGYLYNSQGLRVIDPNSGQPIKVASTSGTLLTKEPIALATGEKAFIYQNPDGTLRTEKIGGTAPQMTPEMASAAKNLIAQGGKPEDVAKLLGLSGQQMAEALQGVTNIPGYASAEMKPQVIYKEDAEGNKIPGYFDPETRTFHYEDGTIETQGTTGTSSYTDTVSQFTPEQQKARTNRHNNPTAFTTDIAKQGGLVEGVDYIAGDAFGSKGQYHTAMLLGNPIEETIRVIDNIGFKNKSGASRWTYTDSLGLNNDVWKSMTHDQKVQAIGEMYKQETDNKFENFSAFLSNGNQPLTAYTAGGNVGAPTAAELALFNEGSKSIGKGPGKLTEQRYNEIASQIQSQQGDKTYTGPIDVGSGAPITYARRIKSMVPATLMNSEIELKNLNDTIGSLYKSATSPEDAALMYMGVDLKPEKKEVGMKMIDALKGSNAQPQVYTAIADELNKGNDKGAVTLLENTLYKDRGINVSDITEIGNNIKNGNNLVNRINALKSKFGPITGNEAKWAQYVKDDKDTQRLLSDMTNFIAKYRNGIAGTSVTSNEEDFLNNIIPTITNNPDNAIAKIQSNMSQSFNGLNTIRDTIGLPTLQDMRSSYDIDFRKQAFTGRGSATQDKAYSKYFTK